MSELNLDRPADALSSSMVTLTLNEDACFLYPENATYWSADVVNGTYEPEIDWLLRRASTQPFAMIDAGANYGFWSILASCEPYGRHSTIAIEPARANYECLLHNAKMNGGRFQTLRRAVLDESGRRLKLYGKKHYGLSLRTDWHPNDVDRFEEVETITLDEVAHKYVPEKPYPVFVKLDIEGAEIEGFKGAHRLIDDGALIVYEDHGKEPTHPVSRYVLSLEDIEVWYVGADKRPTAITTIEQVEAVKIDPMCGYNFFAARRSSPWLSFFHS
jgi:FkbM family methyltransferase